MTSTEAPRTAIVTGAAGGIGRGIAKRLAAGGFAVAVMDRDETACAKVVEQVTAEGGRALAVAVDVTDEASETVAVSRVATEIRRRTERRGVR
ncbi:SDR family NAD(P)-dependent oxidoreductase [Saccharopolyspora tripterygii]